MSIGTFSYPIPVNEPVLSYAPGSAEKKRLKEVLTELKVGVLQPFTVGHPDFNFTQLPARDGIAHGNIIRFAPPLVMNEEQLLDCVSIIIKTLKQFEK